MLDEEEGFIETIQKMNEILLTAYPEVLKQIQSLSLNLCYKDADDYALCALLKDTGRMVERAFHQNALNESYVLLLERYLDLQICLHAIEVRKMDKESMEELKMKMQKHVHLSLPREKDMGYVACTYENLMKAKTLKDYRSYKKYYCNELGL